MKYFPLFFTLLFLFGCTHIGGVDSTVDRLRFLDHYLAEQEFDQALALIEDTKRHSPHDRKFDKEWAIVIEQLRQFEKSTISTALKKEQSGDWPGAKKTYENALVKADASQVLKNAQQAMLLRFQGKMQALEYEELIVNGKWLHKKLPLLKDLHEINPENSIIKWRYNHTKEEARETGLELLQLGEQMLAANNLGMARRTLPLAAALVQGKEVEDATARLDQIMQARKEKKKKNRKIISQVEGDKESEAFNNAMAYGRLSQARKHLSGFIAVTGRSMEAELMQERLDKAIDDYVEEKTSVGTAFYRVGEYEMAIKLWQSIIELQPDNETVKNKIERAKLIVEKVKVLRERQEQK